MLSQTGIEKMFDVPAVLMNDRNRKSRSGSWSCKFAETLIGEYLIVPLTSKKMLQSEAFWMNNCCGGYLDWCADYSYCLFSIRTRSGERLATLGLIENEGAWCLDQCTGPGNSEVLEESLEYLDEEDVAHTEYWPTELYYVAHEVVRLMNNRTEDVVGVTD